ncbi:recombinase family protein [Candidatus Agathobaculum pullicola]|uniref:recombinase family protein n=1 Tax=Candidatus Agathobaculum pullicola TaxID=2838426 RepID=UPI003F90FC2E
MPLGYTLNHQSQKLEVDPITAPLVVEIFTRYAQGATARAIADDLNTRGLRTRRGKPFGLNSFWVILKNRKYIVE